MTVFRPSDNRTQLLLPSPALVFGHSDADGYLAAEQTRRNLKKAKVGVSRVVVSRETANYHFWEESFSKMGFDEYRSVIAVDLAFSFKSPHESLQAVLTICRRYPATQFMIIDHHPLQTPRTPLANLSLISVKRVYDCCFGTPSDEFMAVASICDGGVIVSPPYLRARHLKRALGLKRAVADANLCGEKLLGLLRQRRWSFFEALAEEPPEFHRAFRGRRTSTSFASPLLTAIASSPWKGRTRLPSALRK